MALDFSKKAQIKAQDKAQVGALLFDKTATAISA